MPNMSVFVRAHLIVSLCVPLSLLIFSTGMTCSIVTRFHKGALLEQDKICEACNTHE